MNALEQSMSDLCAKYDLTSIGTSMNLKQADRSRWSVICHWDGFSVRGIPCACEHGATIAEALPKALAAMQADRRIPLQDEAFADVAIQEIAA